MTAFDVCQFRSDYRLQKVLVVGTSQLEVVV